MKLINISLTIFLLLTISASIVLIEFSKNQDLSNLYFKNIELPDNYSEREKLHMQEVKSLTNLSLVLNLISLSIIIFLRKTKINLKKIVEALIIISVLLFIGALFAFPNCQLLGISFLIGKKIKNKTHQITTKNKKYENICIIF